MNVARHYGLRLPDLLAERGHRDAVQGRVMNQSHAGCPRPLALSVMLVPDTERSKFLLGLTVEWWVGPTIAGSCVRAIHHSRRHRGGREAPTRTRAARDAASDQRSRLRRSFCAPLARTPEAAPLCYRHSGRCMIPRLAGAPMRRREFITLIGGAAVWPLAARAQQPAMPVIGLLDSRSPDTFVERLRAIRRGLKETGYVEGENVTIVYRWGEGLYDRLPELAADLVRRQVAMIAATGGIAPASAAKAATTTIPIVFAVPDDPVRHGLVASLARPGGNLTGVNFLASELVAKRLELLLELVPAATRVAVLVNPANPNAGPTVRDMQAAAGAAGLQVDILNASTSHEIDAAFAALVRERPDALFVGGDSFFLGRRVQLSNLAIRHAIPAAFSQRDFAEIGGLMSYSGEVLDAYRQVGVYSGRILNGDKPADLPVVQSAKFQLVINHQTARMLGVTVPPTLLARADEVIE